jgi:hypothetical protein
VSAARLQANRFLRAVSSLKKMPRSDENHRSLCRVTVIVMGSIKTETSRFVEARLAGAGRYPARLNSVGPKKGGLNDSTEGIIA